MKTDGFTTIELIVAIAIAGIIMGAVGTFLTFNLRSFNTTTDIIDTQYEGQLTMTQLVDILKSSDGVRTVSGHTDADATIASRLDAAYKIIPTALEVHHSQWNGVSEEVTQYLITYDGAKDILECRVTQPDNTVIEFEVGRYVTGFYITPVGSDFEMARSFLIELELAENDASLAIESQVKIRNQHFRQP